jgi:transcriptional regulator with XRE-family HTH domain
LLWEDLTPICMMEGMTLQELLRGYGITRPSELADAADITRQYASAIWRGKRHIGGKIALRLYQRRGIPIHVLLQAQVEPTQTPRGRPRKRPRQQLPEPKPSEGEER